MVWFPAPAALSGPAELFHTPVYDRGAMTLQALRQKVGDELDAFFHVWLYEAGRPEPGSW